MLCGVCVHVHAIFVESNIKDMKYVYYFKICLSKQNYLLIYYYLSFIIYIYSLSAKAVIMRNQQDKNADLFTNRQSNQYRICA